MYNKHEIQWDQAASWSLWTPPPNFFKLSFKNVKMVLKSVFLSETVKKFLFPEWVQSMDVLPDWAHGITVLPNWDTGKSENG